MTEAANGSGPYNFRLVLGHIHIIKSRVSLFRFPVGLQPADLFRGEGRDHSHDGHRPPPV